MLITLLTIFIFANIGLSQIVYEDEDAIYNASLDKVRRFPESQIHCRFGTYARGKEMALIKDRNIAEKIEKALARILRANDESSCFWMGLEKRADFIGTSSQYIVHSYFTWVDGEEYDPDTESFSQWEPDPPEPEKFRCACFHLTSSRTAILKHVNCTHDKHFAMCYASKNPPDYGFGFDYFSNFRTSSTGDSVESEANVNTNKVTSQESLLLYGGIAGGLAAAALVGLLTFKLCRKKKISQKKKQA